jgi:glycosyltransferase involved in cell wall biosynthesis
MDKRPQISVLIPVYNAAKYLPACLDSVLSQSMTDFEIVAVDDASTDDSLRILQDYADRDPRIRIVTHERNKGVLSARLTSIRAASGKYILFLDADDGFLPDIFRKSLDAAEQYQADIVHFVLEMRERSDSGSEKLVRYAYPYPHMHQGGDVFRIFFEKSTYIWMLSGKLYRADLCRKAAEFIPDDYCPMAEDFLIYSICAFWAEKYVPMKEPGYRYYVDSGISSVRKTTLEKFMNRQSPFRALRLVRNFLQQQGVWEKYSESFAMQEQKPLDEYVLRWMRHLPDEDRMKAFNGMFRGYDAFPLFLAFRTFFTDKDERFLEMLSGEDPDSASPPGKMERTAENLSLQNTRISAERWNEWQTLIRENRYDAVILEPDDDPERLFWDIRAIRTAGADAVCRRTQNYLETLARKGLNDWLMEDRTLRQASLILASDEDSVHWYRKRNCFAGISLEKMEPPQYCPQTAATMTALEKSEKKAAYYRIDPSPDGETFVPFFRKLDHVFRKLPSGPRKKIFSRLAGIYNRFTGN